MADTWGGSWLASWGTSWGGSGPTPPTTSTVTGGWVHRGYEQGERRRRGLEWDKQDPAKIRAELERVYARISGEDVEAPEVVAAVKPYVGASYDASLPPTAAIDWAAISLNVRAALEVMAALERVLEQRDEEEAFLLMSST